MKRRLVLAVTAAVVVAGYAAAQTNEADALTSAKREAAEASARSEQLQQQAAAATGEAERARAEAEALVAGIQRVEADITAAQAQLALVEKLRLEQRARLGERQKPLVRLTAALQTMAGRPPALALAQPGSVEELVRVRALLASAIPVVRARTASLRGEVADGDRLRAEADKALAALAANQRELRDRQVALARLEEAQRRRSEQLASSSMDAADQSLALDEKARELAALMNSRPYQAMLERELAALPGPALRPQTRHAAASPLFAYRLPAPGRLVTGTGEISDAGVHARGLTFETAAGALAVAPRAGRVAYAGRFRTYGEIVILDHGGGWTSTITGLAALRVRQGDRVKAGDPLGRTGRQLTVELRQNGRPRPLTPFLA